MSSDEIMQGFVISMFAICGVSTVVYCLRMRLKNSFTLKQSPSMEDLNSVDTQDPV